MSSLKKLIAILLTCGLIFQGTLINISHGNYQLEYVKNELTYQADAIQHEIKGGSKLIKTVETFIVKLNTKKRAILTKRLQKAQMALYSKETLSKKEENILLLIEYIQLKLEEKRLLESQIEVKDIVKEYNNTLSDSENKKINAQLIKVQKQILEKGVENLENLIGEFEKYSNYEEKGNFFARFNMDIKNIGEIKARLNLEDYTILNSEFDTQLKTKVKALLDATTVGQEEMKLELAGIIDLIAKDQNFYLLLKKFEVLDEEGAHQAEAFIEKAKEIATKNKYIHIEDTNSAQVMALLQQLTPKNILTEGNKVVSQPLFRAYKKEGNRYYLVPTKYACDSAKRLAQKFDPFHGDTCSQGQYEDMLEELAGSNLRYYMEIGKHTTLGFEGSDMDGIETLTGDISFSDKYIESMNFMALPNQTQYPNEGVEFSYERNSSLYGKIYAQQGEVDILLTGEKRNSIITLDSKIDNNTSFFESNKGNIIFSNDYTSEGFRSNLDFSGKWDARNKVLTAGDFNFSVERKKGTFDYNTYEYTYSGDFEEVFSSNITLKDKTISGTSKIMVDGAEYVSIYHTGKHEKHYFELKNNIVLSERASELFMTSFNSDPLVQETAKTVEGNINVTIDVRSSNNNGNIYFDVILDDKKVMELEIDNTSKKYYKNVEIQAPSNTMPLEEVLENPQY